MAQRVAIANHAVFEKNQMYFHKLIQQIHFFFMKKSLLMITMFGTFLSYLSSLSYFNFKINTFIHEFIYFLWYCRIWFNDICGN